MIWFGTKNIEQSTKLHMHMAVPMTFGCQSHESGLIATQFADGIMGLSYKEDTIISKMYQDGLIANHAFSLCLTKTDGILSFGGTSLLYHHDNDDETERSKHIYNDDDRNSPRHLEKMKMVPLVQSHGYYTIHIKDFQVGGISLKTKEQIMTIFNDGKGTIIDSGTSDTYLPAAINAEFQNVWTKLTNSNHNNNLATYTYADFQRLPNITLELEGDHQWTIQPVQYMEATDASSWIERNSRLFHNRLYVDEPKGAVLGANAMFNHDIVFDITNRMVGIAKADCHMNE